MQGADYYQSVGWTVDDFSYGIRDSISKSSAMLKSFNFILEAEKNLDKL